jgi:hypothetical protein
VAVDRLETQTRYCRCCSEVSHSPHEHAQLLTVCACAQFLHFLGTRVGTRHSQTRPEWMVCSPAHQAHMLHSRGLWTRTSRGIVILDGPSILPALSWLKLPWSSPHSRSDSQATVKLIGTPWLMLEDSNLTRRLSLSSQFVAITYTTSCSVAESVTPRSFSVHTLF